MDLDDPTGQPHASGPFEGVFTTDAAEAADELLVLIPDFDDGENTFGPVVWQPRVTSEGVPIYPAKGDPAYIEQSERGQWIATGWQPSNPVSPVAPFEVWRNAAQPIPNGSLTDVQWEAGAFNDPDAASNFDPSSPWITFQHGGTYTVSVHVAFANNATGNRRVSVLRSWGSGAVLADVRGAVNGDVTIINMQSVIFVPEPGQAVPDFYDGLAPPAIKVQVRQTSGGTLNLPSVFDGENAHPLLVIARTTRTSTTFFT